MEFKGTKGKWRVREWGSPDDVVCEKDELVSVSFPCGDHAKEEREANAKLIACAPELLEMVKLLVERLEENGFEKFNSVKRAKELIKRATE